ncbi:MAG TPA: hypothetical protein DC057_12865 [Spirochaetia bacterium]|nr:hypothetical protein [Spirochaetia bacterium]
MKKTKEEKLDEIMNCVNKEDGLYIIKKRYAEKFEEDSKAEGKGTIQIMTYGNHVIYLKANLSELPHIPLTKFNYTSGTFEKKWGPKHKTIVLTPNHSSIRKVEIEIQGLDIHNMRLLPDKTGDVIEDTAKVKITRHYRFEEGDSENKGDSHKASPGKTKARLIKQ